MKKISSCQLAPALKPGDLLEVVAPSSALKDSIALQKGIKIWQNRGYKIKLSINYNTSFSYLAGTDAQRRLALKLAWQNPASKAILCVRGGYGSTRLLEDWSWEIGEAGGAGGAEEAGVTGKNNILNNIKWLIGFSDITALLWSLAQEGIAGVHGPVLTTLAKEPEWSIARLFDLVEGRSLKPLQGIGWGGTKKTGMLLPGNFTVATHLLGTPIQPDFDNVILALEDVTEFPYRIDRMLTQWRASGILKKIKGLALGRFSRCDPHNSISSWTVAEVWRDRTADLNIPIVWDLPFGHDGANAALRVGQMVELDGEAGILKFLQENYFRIID